MEESKNPLADAEHLLSSIEAGLMDAFRQFRDACIELAKTAMIGAPVDIGTALDRLEQPYNEFMGWVNRLTACWYMLLSVVATLKVADYIRRSQDDEED